MRGCLEMSTNSQNAPKKIMYLHSGAELYGADQILYLLTTNIDKNKYEPIVVLPNDGPLREKLEESGVNVKIIPYPIARRKSFTPIGLLSFLVQYHKSKKELIRFVIGEKIALIHSNTLAVISGAAIKKKTKVPLVVHLHEMVDHPRFVAKVLYKNAIRGADVIVVVSDAVKRHIEQILNKKIENIKVIHNGLNVDVKRCPNNGGNKEKLGFDNNKKLVGIVGRVNAIKGQDHFINMMSLLDTGIQGAIVGDAFSGQEWRVAVLKQQIIDAKLEKRVKYLGFVSDTKLVFDSIDALVLPSVENDSFPTVVLESFSYGKPVVAYRCGGVEEMVEDGVNGYLVPQGDVNALAEAVRLTLSDERYERLSKAAFETVRNKFRLSDFIDKFEVVYEALL